jgi:hypothetical protein
MRNLSAKHQGYLREAEEMYSSAEGDYFAAEGGNDDYFAAEGNAGNVKIIPDFDRTYTVTIVNANAVLTNATIGGANQFLTVANFGNPAGITVTVGESSYLEFLQESQQMPFRQSGFRITSGNVAQLDQVLSVTKRTGNGQICTYPIQVANYFSAFQFQAGIRELYPYVIEWTGQTQILVPVLALTTVVFTLFVGKRLDVANSLRNSPEMEVSPHKLPFVQKQEVVLSAGAASAVATA